MVLLDKSTGQLLELLNLNFIDYYPQSKVMMEIYDQEVSVPLETQRVNNSEKIVQ